MKLDRTYLNRIKNNDEAIRELSIQGAIDRHTGWFDTCSFEDIQLLGEALKNNTIITSLKISHVYLRAKEMSVLADILVTNKTIKKVSFRANEISSKELKLLTEALAANSTLTHLDLIP